MKILTRNLLKERRFFTIRHYREMFLQVFVRFSQISRRHFRPHATIYMCESPVPQRKIDSEGTRSTVMVVGTELQIRIALTPIRICLFTLMRIRIRLPKMMRIWITPIREQDLRSLWLCRT